MYLIMSMTLWMGLFFFSAIQMSSHQCEQTFCPGRSKKDPHKSSLSCHQLFLLIGIQFPFAKVLHTASLKNLNMASIHIVSPLRQTLVLFSDCIIAYTRIQLLSEGMRLLKTLVIPFPARLLPLQRCSAAPTLLVILRSTGWNCRHIPAQ